MLRSSQAILKQAARRAPSSLSASSSASSACSSSSLKPHSILSRSSSNAASTDYDQIMNTRLSSAKSNAASGSVSYFSSMGATPPSPPQCAATVQQTMSSHLYRCVDDPTQHEDYDTYELHHPPTEKTTVSYYEASFQAGPTTSN